MNTTNQMTSHVSLHLISGNHTLHSGNRLYKQIEPGYFLEINELRGWRPAQKDLYSPYTSSHSIVEIHHFLSQN